MKKRKFFLGVALAAAVAGLASCGKDNKKKENNTTTAQATTTVATTTAQATTITVQTTTVATITAQATTTTVQTTTVTPTTTTTVQATTTAQVTTTASVTTTTQEVHEHIYNKETIIDKYLKSEATHESPALYYYSCVCGEMGSTTFEYGNAIPHTFDQQDTSSTHVKTAATCTSKAEYYYSCVCGANGTDTFTGSDVLGHSYKYGVCEKCHDVDLVNNLYAVYDGAILFGTYPQSKVTDSGLLAQLTELMPEVKPSNEDSKGFTGYPVYGVSSDDDPDYTMWYKDIDIDLDGLYDYRCMYAEDYVPRYAFKPGYSVQSIQYYNGYYTGEYYFFKFEPIRWHIFTEYSDAFTLYAEIGLDCRQYNYTSQPTRLMDGTVINSSDYSHSSVREWLNYDFFNTAFSNFQQNNMVTMKVDNVSGLPGELIGTNTFDYVWIFSHEDMGKLCNSGNVTFDVTDYAESQAASVANNITDILLRTPDGENWVKYYLNNSNNLPYAPSDSYGTVIPVITMRKTAK